MAPVTLEERRLLLKKLFKQRLMNDSDESLQALFEDDSWMGQPMSAYYGDDEEADIRVNRSIVQTLDAFRREGGILTSSEMRKQITSLITPATIVNDGGVHSALVIMGPCLMHTTAQSSPIPPALSAEERIELIGSIFRQQLIDDSNESLQALFEDESWRAEPLSTYYGDDEETNNRIDQSVGHTVAVFYRETQETSDGDRRAKRREWIMSRINPATIVHIAGDMDSAIEIMNFGVVFIDLGF